MPNESSRNGATYGRKWWCMPKSSTSATPNSRKARITVEANGMTREREFLYNTK